ncbi:MAG: hypothetical protein ACREBG_16720, partial [Pyrinomonadaceae bacterium]
MFPLDQPEITEPIAGIEPEQMENFASDPDVVAQLKKSVLPKLERTRKNRDAKMGDDWERYRDVYNLRRSITFYDGRSKLFLGALRDAVDTLTRVAKDSILADPYLMVETDVPRWQETGVDFIKYLLEKQAGIRAKTSMFLRQLYQIGTSCFKFGWKKSVRSVKYRTRGDLGAEIKTRQMYDHYGPTLEVLDMTQIYVWPESAVDYESLTGVFEDNITTIEEVRKKVERGFYDPAAADKAIEAKEKSLAAQRNSGTQQQKEGIALDEDSSSEEMDITELWVKFELPETDTETADDAGDYPWVWVTLLGKEIVRVQENPWWFQHPPYLFGAIFREHDNFYGHGLV